MCNVHLIGFDGGMRKALEVFSTAAHRWDFFWSRKLSDVGCELGRRYMDPVARAALHADVDAVCAQIDACAVLS